MAKKIRVGVIGTGGISRAQAKVLVEIEGVEIVAGADVNEEALKEFAEKFDCPQTFTDYNEMLKLDELDAVTVCTPNSLHKAPVIAALQAGKDVMVEKPMAMNAVEGQEMVDAAEAAGKTLCIGFQWRLGPQSQALKKFAREDRFGKVMYVRVEAMRRKGVPSWGVFTSKELNGGGPLIDIGVHAIEVGHYLMGEPKPVSASAQTWTYLGDKPVDIPGSFGAWNPEGYNVEDLAVGQIRFDNGAIMAVECSFIAHIEKDVFNVTLMGEKGGARMLPPVVYTDESGAMVNVELQGFPEYPSMQRKMQDWVAYLRGERETECPASAGLAVQKMLDALYRSAEEGREVAID
jgi:predicted dehydrogenase